MPDFRVNYLWKGPMTKLLYTVGILITLAITDYMLKHMSNNVVPPHMLLYGSTTFILLTALLDVAKKYGVLTDSKLATWIENKFGSAIKTDA